MTGWPRTELARTDTNRHEPLNQNELNRHELPNRPNRTGTNRCEPPNRTGTNRPDFQAFLENAVVTKLFAPKFCAEWSDREIPSSHGDHFRDYFSFYASGRFGHHWPNRMNRTA